MALNFLQMSEVLKGANFFSTFSMPFKPLQTKNFRNFFWNLGGQGGEKIFLHFYAFQAIANKKIFENFFGT